MEFLDDINALESLYGSPSKAALRKVATQLTPLYRKWIMTSRFCVLSTVGPDGTDASPRGDDGPVVLELDARTLAMPDWRGNNRLDSLRNIVVDPRVSLMFMVPGSDTIVRVNGRAGVTVDPDLCARFDKVGKRPASVVVIGIHEIYAQCARAPMRAGIWARDDSADLPTLGAILAEVTSGEEGGEAYDRAWPERALKFLW